MKNVALVTLTALVGLLFTEIMLMQQQIEIQSLQYERKMEVQQAEYIDEIIDLKQKLYGKTFELDMATNHIELLNADH